MSKHAFTLLEVTIVLFVMGLTISALLNIFEWSHARYTQAVFGMQEAVFLSDLHTWLREQVISDKINNINVQNLKKAVPLQQNIVLNGVKIKQYGPDTYFIAVEYFSDYNRNKKPDAPEINKRLFCFRRRSA